jgi:acetolactate synthase-1/2/3 large subunit
LNFSTGAAYAQLGAMPMVLLTGQKAIMSAHQAKFQIVDVIASMKPLTKMARQIVTPTMIPTIVRDAFRVAQEERPGPVLLELPGGRRRLRVRRRSARRPASGRDCPSRTPRRSSARRR